jgi:uncharacterized membrane protein
LLLTEGLTIAANDFLGIDPFLRLVSGVAVLLMSFALVGLATGLGARYPRFNADNPSQVAGSYGGVAFMILAVVVIITVIVLVGWPSSEFLWYRASHLPIPSGTRAAMAACFAAAVSLAAGTWWAGMRTGVRALEAMGV